MSLEVNPVSFSARMPQKRINTAKIIDSANKAAEDFRLAQRSKDEQFETVLRRSFKKFTKFLLDSMCDPKC